MSVNPPKKPQGSVLDDSQDLELEDQIRQRAYELYEERGREEGHEEEDWLRAEAEIMQKKAGTIAA
jgi:Protein of unknown function (DUF2934)